MDETRGTKNARAGAALVGVDFSTAAMLLQDDRAWGARVLGASGFPGWYWRPFLVWSRLAPSRILPESRAALTAWGAVGRYFTLVYRVEAAGPGRIRVTPCEWLPAPQKLEVLALLALVQMWPALFAPLAWKLIGLRNAHVSRRCLPGFCRYLTEQVESRGAEPRQ